MMIEKNTQKQSVVDMIWSDEGLFLLNGNQIVNANILHG